MFAAGNDPVEREGMKTQEKKGIIQGKEGVGSGALGLREEVRSSGPSL